MCILGEDFPQDVPDDPPVIIRDEAQEPDAEYVPWQEDVIQVNESQFLFTGPPSYVQAPSKRKSRGWLRHFLVFTALLYFALVVVGPYFDAACTKGRLSGVQARAINDHDWNKCPKYMNGVCEAKRRDRVLSYECADLSRKILFRDQVNDVRRWWRE